MAVVRTEQDPDHRAFVYLDNGESLGPELTNAAFHRRCCAIGAALSAQGKPGDRVLLLYPPGLDFITAFFGAMYAGMVPVPTTPPDPTRLARSIPRFMAIVRNADTRLALTSSALMAFGGAMIESQPELQAMRWTVTDTLDDAEGNGWAPRDADLDSLAYLQYTSGSTSIPKGVVITHGNVLGNLGALEVACQPTPNECLVTWLPQFHDMGLISQFACIYADFTCVVMSPLDFLRRPVRWLQAITNFRGVYSASPNFAFDLCVRRVTEAERAQLDLSSWNVAINGSEPVRWDVLQRFAQTFGPCGFRMETMSPAFGLAEAVLFVCMVSKGVAPRCLRVKRDALERHRIVEASAGDPGGRDLVGCGTPCPGTDVRIVNPETTALCGDGEVGEIWVHGPEVAQGYWNNPEATEATFGGRMAGSDEGPFLRTGDLGFVRGGDLYITGRIKDMIIVRGANHYPEDIEITVSNCHAALRPGCACAFSVDADGEEALVVVQEVRDESAQQGDALVEAMRAVRNTVADVHGIQTHGVVLIAPRTLLKTSSGKIQRSATRDAYLESGLDIVAQDIAAQASPRAEDADASLAERVRSLSPARRQGVLESYLRKELARALGMDEDEISVGVAFLDLGIDSMKAMELMANVERDLGVRLEPKEFFDRPTLLELATFLNGRMDTAAPRGEAHYEDEVEEGGI